MPATESDHVDNIKIKYYNTVIIYRLIYSFNVIPNNILQDFMVLQLDSQMYVEESNLPLWKSWIAYLWLIFPMKMSRTIG